ncbi:MAG: CsgG/HfaB family protein [Verrucomicrobia bacterium]|nr:CsgG/HfaB family protein [Verrucomicrobiota bacterium]
MKPSNASAWGSVMCGVLVLVGCATESSRSVTPPQVQRASSTRAGDRLPVRVGKFDNRSSYMRGIFSDGVDRLGGQAQTILVTHLQQTGKFSVLDRANMTEIKEEAAYANQPQAIKGAVVTIAGDVTDFGRKEVGDQQLFGIMGSGKSQIAYAKVSLYVVDVRTAEVIASVQGAGEYALSNREVLGFGGTASYDATLNGKVLDLAVREAVEKLVASYDQGWTLPR